MTEPIGDRRPFNVVQIIKDAFCLYKNNFMFFLAISLLANVVTLLESSLFTVYFDTWLVYGGRFLKTIVYYSGNAILIFAIYQKINKQTTSIKDAFSHTKTQFLKFIIVAILSTLVCWLGGLLFIIPGIYLGVMFCCVSFFVVLEKATITESFKKSFLLVKGYFWGVVGAYALCFLGAGLLYLPLLMSYWVKIDYTYMSMLYVVPAVVGLPLIEAVGVLVFVRLKECKGQSIAPDEYPGKRKKDITEIILFLLLVVALYASVFYLFKFISKGGRSRVCSLASAPKRNVRPAFETTKPQLVANDPNPQIFEEDPFIVYVPSQIDLSKKYPMIIALTPSANGQFMIDALANVAEKHKCIIYASKKFRNGLPMNNQLREIILNLDWVLSNFPVNESRIISVGCSGGGMGSHAFSFFAPDLISAVIVNTGMMHHTYLEGQDRVNYPKGKLAVFLASPTDVRYEEMQRDQKFLKSKGWKTRWVEFEGGHIMAPEAVWMDAVEWLQLEFDGKGGGDEVAEGAPEATSPSVGSDAQSVLDGLVKNFYEDGSLLEEVHYKDGKKNGPAKTYYQSGALWYEGSYSNDKKDGVFQVYNEDGTHQTMVSYREGKYDGPVKSYDVNGRLERDAIYENGQQISRRIIRYTEDGKISRETESKNGKRDGIDRFYNDDGSLDWEVNYKDGAMNGKAYYYDGTGEVVLEYEYVDGKMQHPLRSRWRGFLYTLKKKRANRR